MNVKLYLRDPLKYILLEQCFPNSPNMTQLGRIKKYTDSQTPAWRF